VSAGTAVSDLTRGPARTTAEGRRWPLAPATIAVATLTVLAAALRFYGLGHQGFWFDEGNTALLVHFSPGKMLGLIPQSESTPPLYYCLAWIWARVFGYGEIGLRSLSAVAGILVVPVAYGIARSLISERAGVIAAALAAFNPLLIWYSQEARSYQLLVLLSGLSLLTFVRLHADPVPRRAVAWAIASALALATHYYAVLIVVPEVAWLLFALRHRRPVQVAIAVVALCGLALIPLALSQSLTQHAKWIHQASLARRLKQIAPQFVIGFGSPAYGVLEPLALVLAGFGLVLLVTRSDRAQRRAGLLAGGLALAGLIIALLLVAGGVDDLLTRNLFALWMPAMIAVAAGFAASRARRLGAVAAALLCVIGVVAVVGVTRERDLQRPDWRPVARLLGPPPATGRLILIQHYRDLLPLSLYTPHLKSSGARPATVSEFDVISFTSPRSSGFCWWGSACNLHPSRMQSSYTIPGFTAVSRRSVERFSVLRMVALRPVLVRRADVERALRTTRLANDELLIQR
jgi:mannosyltransferase